MIPATIWSSTRRGKVAGAIHGFGKLLDRCDGGDVTVVQYRRARLGA